MKLVLPSGRGGLSGAQSRRRRAVLRGLKALPVQDRGCCVLRRLVGVELAAPEHDVLRPIRVGYYRLPHGLHRSLEVRQLKPLPEPRRDVTGTHDVIRLLPVFEDICSKYGNF